MILVGAVVQGAVGFGMNLVAAPLRALLDPSARTAGAGSGRGDQR
ncbi:MAG TPA: hypothetical protein VGJ95_15640 [Pseudonocardiaceae bacterium]